MATFRTRTGKKGTTVTCMVRMAGFPTQTETFPNASLAKRWATKTEADILEGRTSKDSLGRKRTLADAIERFRKEVLPLKRDGSMYGFTLDWWLANYGTRKLGEMSRAMLVEARGTLLTGTFTRATPGSKRSSTEAAAAFQRSPATCNRYMAALSAVFSQVCGDWEWLQATSNPFAGLSKLPEGRNKGRAYADDARAKLLEQTAKDPQLHVLVQVALATAARAGELIGLTWSHVELGDTEGRLMFTNTKNGDARIAWVFSDALKALKGHMMERVPRPDGLMLGRPVFPGQWSHAKQAYGRYDYLPRLHKALEAAGLKMSRPFHALRHTAATNMAIAGANGHQLKALGGWKSDAVNRYIHLAAQDTKHLALAHSKTLEGK